MKSIKLTKDNFSSGYKNNPEDTVVVRGKHYNNLKDDWDAHVTSDGVAKFDTVSPYTTSGNVLVNSQKRVVAEGTGAAVTLTAADSGKVFFINSDSGSTTYTLPAPAAGLTFKWVFTNNNTDPTVITTADKTDTTGDMLRGCLFLHSTDNDTTVVEATGDVNTLTLDDNLTNANCGYGSWVEVICVEDPIWFISGMINGNTGTTGTGAAMFSDSDA